LVNLIGTAIKGTSVKPPLMALATRPLLPQHDCPTPIEADDLKRVLADIDTEASNTNRPKF
jgi:hypothetical protein